MGIASYQDAKAHYVDWLGFNIEWQWRQNSGAPVLAQIQRNGVAIQLVEIEEHHSNIWIQILVDDIVELSKKLHKKRTNRVDLADNFPYVRQINVQDLSGNLLVFEQLLITEKKQEMEQQTEKMRQFVRINIEKGKPFPNPNILTENFYPLASFSTYFQASDDLFEFPDYAKTEAKDNSYP